jgi:hypothetical protein
LRKDGPRYAELHTLWGDEPIPVKDYVAVRNQGPDRVENFFLVDWKRLSPEMQRKLVDHILKKWSRQRPMLTAGRVFTEMAGTYVLPLREREVNPPAIPLKIFVCIVVALGFGGALVRWMWTMPLPKAVEYVIPFFIFVVTGAYILRKLFDEWP